ncbi:MAG: DUF1828 domain-containing protein [Pseudomonadota bacterium]
MSLKERICEAFCADVSVNPFRGGYGISTPFSDASGDSLGYYLLGPSANGKFRIVDDALTVASFESEGATLDSHSRLDAFNQIITAYSARYNDESGEIYIEDVAPSDIERKSLDFLALMLRLQDMYLLTQERVRNTFYDDVSTRIASIDVPGLQIQEKTAVSDETADVVPDYVFRHEGSPMSAALFVTNTNEKLWQAMHLKLISEYETNDRLAVVAMLENENVGTSKLRTKASNRLDALPIWQGDEAAAITRVLRVAGVPTRH